MLCKDKQQTNKHRGKADALYPQDLTARENAAQDSKVVKKRELGTLEMTQDEQQKTPPVQLLEMVDNSSRLCTRIFGWFFAMLLGRQTVSSSKLTRLSVVSRITQPVQDHFLGQWLALPAFKQGSVEGGN